MIRKAIRFDDGLMTMPLPRTNVSRIMDVNRSVLAKVYERKNKILTDAEGLRRAYNEPNRIYVNGDRMYIAGTTWTNGKYNPTNPSLLDMLFTDEFGLPPGFSLQDAWDDLKIPFNLTSKSERYQDADEILKENPQIKQLILHSLGGSVALELNKNYGEKYETRTYSAPVFDPIYHAQENNNNIRMRTAGDPIAMFDNNAETVFKPTLNPLSLHS